MKEGEKGVMRGREGRDRRWRYSRRGEGGEGGMVKEGQKRREEREQTRLRKRMEGAREGQTRHLTHRSHWHSQELHIWCPSVS